MRIEDQKIHFVFFLCYLFDSLTPQGPTVYSYLHSSMLNNDYNFLHHLYIIIPTSSTCNKFSGSKGIIIIRSLVFIDRLFRLFFTLPSTCIKQQRHNFLAVTKGCPFIVHSFDKGSDTFVIEDVRIRIAV